MTSQLNVGLCNTKVISFSPKDRFIYFRYKRNSLLADIRSYIFIIGQPFPIVFLQWCDKQGRRKTHCIIYDETKQYIITPWKKAIYLVIRLFIYLLYL